MLECKNVKTLECTAVVISCCNKILPIGNDRSYL